MATQGWWAAAIAGPASAQLLTKLLTKVTIRHLVSAAGRGAQMVC